MREHESVDPRSRDRDPLAWEIDVSLRALATPRAPLSLLPRVLAATTLRPAGPWYARSWQAWSPDRRVAASMVGVAALLSLLWGAGLVLTGGWLGGASAFDVIPAALQPFVARASAGLAVLGTLWNALGAPLAAVLAPVVIACGAACAVCGLALRRLVPGGTSCP